MLCTCNGRESDERSHGNATFDVHNLETVGAMDRIKYYLNDKNFEI